MAYLKPEFVEPVLVRMAELIVSATDNPLVTFEIERRLTNVPGNLMELFFLEKNVLQCRAWHTMSPWDRFGFTGTLMRRRVHGVSLLASVANTLQIQAGDLVINLDLKLPRRYRNSTSFWKGMDDYCLLIAVCFYISVLQESNYEPNALFDDALPG